MKIEDPFSPPGDQPDLNKLRRTKQPLPVLGSKPVPRPCVQPGLLLSGKGEGQRQRSLLRRTPVPAAIWAHRVTARQCPFIGAAGWTSESWSQGWRAASCRRGPAGRGAPAAGRLGWCPLPPVPRCFPLSGCSAALDTQSAHSETPGERRQKPMSDRPVSHPGAATSGDTVLPSSGGRNRELKEALPASLPPCRHPAAAGRL